MLTEQNVILFELAWDPSHNKFFTQLFKIILSFSLHSSGIIVVIAFNLIEFFIKLMERSPIDIAKLSNSDTVKDTEIS